MREASVSRSTKETQIEIVLCLDGGEVDVSTGVGFFDHMLCAFGQHSGYGLTVKTEGDLIVDCHHTVEDTGIALGTAIARALGNRGGIKRFGSANIPMDEALASCSLDVGGRSFLHFQGEFPQERIGDFDTCMAEEFFRAVADNSGITLHLACPYGRNSHHMIEAMFKAFAHAMAQATRLSHRGGILSTKGDVESSFEEISSGRGLLD